MGPYFDDKDLAHFGDLKEHAPELWEMFEKYYGAAFQPGLLSKARESPDRLCRLPGFPVSLLHRQLHPAGARAGAHDEAPG